ncbi:MAG: glycosyltransferase family 4 protein [Thermoanaerobaculia bacterium]
MKVVVYTADVVGEQMAGPGIRAWHLARELAARFETTLIARLDGVPPGEEKAAPLRLGSEDAARALSGADVLIGQPEDALLRRAGSQRVIFDLFDPNVLELRELYRDSHSPREWLHETMEWRRLRRALATGAALVAASRAQIGFYSGIRAGERRTAAGWSERWMEVPFGIPDEPPSGEPPAMIRNGDPVIIWGGGMWEWLDPELAIDAVVELNRRGTRCRLLFLGGARPHAGSIRAGKPGRMEEKVRAAGDRVLLNREWVPYAERGRWLLGSRGAIMLHRSTMEAEFSIRTRLFDALWCGVPVIATRGGFAADLVNEEGLGIVTEAGDLESVVEGMRRMVEDDVSHARSVKSMERVRSRFLWRSVAAPLIERIEGWRSAR